MSPSFRRQSGFSLVEFLVVVAALGMILWIFGQLFFPMQKLATRQRLDVEARQTARAAADYLHYMLRGAGDMNSNNSGNRTPALLLTQACFGSGLTQSQVTIDNNANANLADIGTDTITFCKAAASAPVLFNGMGGVTFPGSPSGTASQFSYTEGCTGTDSTSSDANLTLFKAATGGHPVGSGYQSEVLTVYNQVSGIWGFYQITDYSDASNADCCSAAKRFVTVIANPTSTQLVTPFWVKPPATVPACNNFPDPTNMGGNPNLVPGARFYSLRVRNGWLEQKVGVFNPATDNPGTDFVQILPNVEDLQFAYLFNNNQIRNNLSTNRLPSAQGYVPGGDPALGFNVTNVWAIRFTVTVRSTAAVPGGLNVNNIQPSAEDHDPTADNPPKVKDNYYHVQISGMAILRNRAVGS